MSEWRNIESAPMDGSVILGYQEDWVTNEKGPYPLLLMFFDKTDGWGMTVDGFVCHPTHWMPLPNPPETNV